MKKILFLFLFCFLFDLLYSTEDSNIEDSMLPPKPEIEVKLYKFKDTNNKKNIIVDARFKLKKNYYIFHSEDFLSIEFYLDDKKLNYSSKLIMLEPNYVKEGIGGIHKEYFEMLRSFEFDYDNTKNINVVVNYQMCNEDGICYIPDFQEFKNIDSKTFEDVKTYDGKIDITPILGSKEQDISDVVARSQDYSILFILLIAFFGGFMLNFTPCIFPLIPIRIMNIVSNGKEKFLSNTLFYSFGVLTTFFGLGVLFGVLKFFGETLNWGFQLQNPYYNLGVSLIILAFCLSLFEVFDMPSISRTSKLGNSSKALNIESYLNGLFSVFIASSCTAPIIGSFLGIVLSFSIIVEILIFLIMGVGFVSPFFILVAFPKLLNYLPKPGNWMLMFKKIIALFLIGVIFYFMNTYFLQVGLDNFLYTGLLFVITTIIIILLSSYIKNKAKYNYQKNIAYLVAILSFSVGFYIFQPTFSNEPNAISLSHKKEDWKDFSENSEKEYISNEKDFFVYFYAAWCANCKINYRLVFSQDDINQELKNKGITVLYGDFTLPNKDISKQLEKWNLVGLPAYGLYKKGKLIKIYSGLVSHSEFMNDLKTF